MSPTLREPVKAIWIPAKIFVSDDCAARPATSEARPADASSEAPMARNWSKVRRAPAAAAIHTTPIRTLVITCIWVRMRRNWGVSRAFRLRAMTASSTVLMIPVTP